VLRIHRHCPTPPSPPTGETPLAGVRLNPRLPDTPAARAPRHGESILSVNGSPLAMAASGKPKALVTGGADGRDSPGLVLDLPELGGAGKLLLVASPSC
jgi:hypothetical protein